MTARKIKAKAVDPTSPTPAEWTGGPGETNRQIFARKMTGPYNRHAVLEAQLLLPLAEGLPPEDRAGLVEYAQELKARCQRAAAGDLEQASELLLAQAFTLDVIFAEYARLSALNVLKSLDGADRLMRLALKAQAGSRATIDTLARMHQPREQTVRHVHVNEGGQAVIAEEFHHHTGGQGNENAAGQPHTAGTGAAGASPALPSPNPLGQAVPVPGGEGQRAMSNARRQGKRRA